MAVVQKYTQVQNQCIDDVVRRHAPLVQRIAHHLTARLPPAVQADDLVQAGMAGLLEAVRAYDPEQGAAFETYATIRIRGAMLDEIRRCGWAPRSAHRNAREVAKAVAELRKKSGREPREHEVAEFLGLAMTEYRQLLEGINRCRVLSLDDPVGGESVARSGLADQSTGPVDQVQAEEFARCVAENINKLPEQERVVVSLYYSDELNFREIGSVLGVTESRVCQIHGQALIRLRASMDEWRDKS